MLNAKPLLKYLVEGWRFVPHSFSVVNSFQCLELLKRKNIQLFHHDVEFIGNSWKPQGFLDEISDQQLKEIPSDNVDDSTTVIRISYPLRLQPSPAKKILTMAVTNFGVLPITDCSGCENFSKISDNLSFITPSEWSRQGLLRSGIDEKKIHLLPHGIDPQIYYPLKKTERDDLRQKFGWSDRFIFLNIGAMTHNKGIDLLLTAFSKIIKIYPDAFLVLKGLDDLYRSQDFLKRSLSGISDQKKILSHMGYIGESLDCSQIAKLYQASDAYISPYRGEGFNLPVLEAIACGLPVICTDGGPTDDFTNTEVSLKIKSHLETFLWNDQQGLRLSPDENDLFEKMSFMILNASWRETAQKKSQEWVKNWTWEKVIDQLLTI